MFDEIFLDERNADLFELQPLPKVSTLCLSSDFELRDEEFQNFERLISFKNILHLDFNFCQYDITYILKRFPNIDPVFPLKNSKVSGFFFCGIIDEPVTILSFKLMNLN